MRAVGRAAPGPRSPLASLLLRCLRFYQTWISPLLAPACRFHPTCSHYACEAIEVHGGIRGAWLTLKRLLRCQPFCPGGFDPLPRQGAANHAMESS